jgi:polyisoprenoid-binding protein YceI
MIAIVAAFALLAQEETYFVGHHEKFVNVTFESNADFETIVGTTNKATGEIMVDRAKQTGKVSLTVPVASMKTGIDMRDEHLRSAMWMDEAKHPTITFVSKKVEPVKDAKNKFKVTGEFKLHGVAREMTVDVEWRELPADVVEKAKFPNGKWLKFTSEFRVKLSDHGITVPAAGLGKVEDAWTVKMQVFASTAAIEKR